MTASNQKNEAELKTTKAEITPLVQSKMLEKREQEHCPVVTSSECNCPINPIEKREPLKKATSASLTPVQESHQSTIIIKIDSEFNDQKRLDNNNQNSLIANQELVTERLKEKIKEKKAPGPRIKLKQTSKNKVPL